MIKYIVTQGTLKANREEDCLPVYVSREEITQ